MDHPEIANLSEADCRALDALVEGGFKPSAVSAKDRQRADQLLQLFSLLDYLPSEKATDLLTARTLQRLAHLRQQERFARQISSLQGGGAVIGRISLRDLVATAAMFLISMSLLWPMLSQARGTARQIACQANLGSLGSSLAAYSMDNRGAMPAQKLRVGDPWLRTNEFTEDGYALSNSAHLFHIARQGYAAPQSLACSENPSALDEINEAMRDFPTAAAASFSYQNQYASRKPRLNGSTVLPVVADKNPFFETGKYHAELRPLTNSTNHVRRGQNVLMSDGRVMWLGAPFVPGETDNIFHAGDTGLDSYEGTETPVDERDAFLVQ